MPMLDRPIPQFSILKLTMRYNIDISISTRYIDISAKH